MDIEANILFTVHEGAPFCRSMMLALITYSKGAPFYNALSTAILGDNFSARNVPSRGGLMPITPYLYYEDLPGALKFLAKAFGFKKYGAAMRGKDGELNHAAMKLGTRDLVMMGYPGPKYKGPKRLG